MTVYLVNETCYDIAISYSSQDSSARVVLLEDAVYHALKETKSAGSIRVDGRCYTQGLEVKDARLCAPHYLRRVSPDDGNRKSD